MFCRPIYHSFILINFLFPIGASRSLLFLSITAHFVSLTFALYHCLVYFFLLVIMIMILAFLISLSLSLCLIAPPLVPPPLRKHHQPTIVLGRDRLGEGSRALFPHYSHYSHCVLTHLYTYSSSHCHKALLVATAGYHLNSLHTYLDLCLFTTTTLVTAVAPNINYFTTTFFLFHILHLLIFHPTSFQFFESQPPF